MQRAQSNRYQNNYYSNCLDFCVQYYNEIVHCHNNEPSVLYRIIGCLHLFRYVQWAGLNYMSMLSIRTNRYTPASNLGYLAPPRTIFHGCQIVHWDPLDGKRRCPQKKFWFGLCEIAWFLCQPIANLRRGVCL